MIKKGLAGFFISVFLMGGISAESETRTNGMGLGSESWAVDGQLPFIFINPAYLGNIGPIIYGETGGGVTNSKGGAVIGFGSFNLGLFIGQTVNTEHTNLFNMVNLAPSATNAAGIPGAALNPASVFTRLTGLQALVNQNATLMGQMSFGKITAGLSVSYARTGSDNKNNTETISLAESSLNVILGAMMPLGSMDLDASIGYRSTDVNNSYSLSGPTKYSASLKNDGIGDIIIDAHLGIPASSGKYHIMAGFDLLNASSVASYSGGGTSLSDSFDRKGMRIRAGVSDELKINDNVTGFAGLGFVYETMTKKYSGSSAETYSIFLPLFIGVEASLTDHWQVRFGAGANGLNIGPDLKDFTDIWNNSSPYLALGTSVIFDNFSLDWDVNPSIMTSGLTNPVVAWASSFAASYKFTSSGKTPIRKNL